MELFLGKPIDNIGRDVGAEIALCHPTSSLAPFPLNPLHMLKNPLAFLPTYPKITDQIKKVEPQALFFLIKDKTIVTVISKKVSRHRVFAV